MLKKHMAACLVASAFMTMPVLAQTSTSPGGTSSGANQPAMSTSSSGSSGASAASGSGHFITQQQQNQWRASKLIGINVYGADNEKIGDINEVLVDRQGNADAVVIGVGGFLGIGEKNVALPFNAFEWQMEDTRRTASASGSGNTSSAGAARSTSGDTASTAGTTATTGSGTAASGNAAGTTASTTSAGSNSARSSSNADRGYPDHAVLRMSKADLQNAPTFRYVGDRSTDNNSGSNANRASGSGAGSSGSGTSGGTSTAPRQ